MDSGKALKIMRLARGLTQQQLADKLGIRQQAISKMERHERIGRKKIVQIISILNFSKQELEEVKRIIAKRK